MASKTFKTRCYKRRKAIFTTSKFAIALVLVRNTPKSTNAKTFATLLAHELRVKIDKCNEKENDLKKELLALRQQNILLQIKHGMQNRNNDSCQGEVPIKTLSSPIRLKVTGNENGITSSLNFMKNVIAAKHQCKSLHLGANDTFILTLTGVIKGLLLSIQKTRMDEVATSHLNQFSTLIKGICASKLCFTNKGIIRLCFQLADEIITLLTSTQNRFKAKKQEVLCEVLTALGTIKSLNAALMDRLTEVITNYQKVLSGHCKNRTNVSPYDFNNVCNILTTIEKILLCYHENNPAPDDVHKALLNGFGNSLCELLANFPLFVHYIWKIMAILELKSVCQPPGTSHNAMSNSASSVMHEVCT